jgi:hypothetical protein
MKAPKGAVLTGVVLRGAGQFLCGGAGRVGVFWVEVLGVVMKGVAHLGEVLMEAEAVNHW